MNLPPPFRNKLLVLAMGALALLGGIALLAINPKLFEYVVLILSAMALFFKYLQTEEPTTKATTDMSSISKDLSNQLGDLKSEIKSLSTKTVSQEDQAKLAEQLQKHVDQFIAQGKNIQGVEFSEKTSTETKQRLSRAIVVAQKFGKVNLFVGLVISAIGVVFLWTLLPTPQTQAVTTWLELLKRYSEISNWSTLVEHYLPRLTMVIFMELLAYFFLKLYKASLADVKYFENELTMIEMRYSSLGVALRMENRDAIKDCLAQLARFERNNSSTMINDEEGDTGVLHELTEAIKLLKEARKD